ncbi:MAG: avidin/streptavidin family protein [Allorhizobium sp.]|uniref:avidin/streptavidin family protein n=1 Tax=Allorhizobium sp. TaxID=633478 RepID=UPI004033D874
MPIDMEEAMSVLGRWRNEYGSILDIRSQAPNGSLSGIYTSDTGASGTYMMNGWCPFDATGTQNAPISVNIFWKPTDSTVEDPSWNWVSNMTGALFYDAPTGVPRLQLLHGMVASTLFPAVQVDRPGVYTETLGFDLLPDPLARTRAPTLRRGGRALKAATYTLTNLDPGARVSSIRLITENDGSAIGSVTLPSELVSGLGFVDPTPPANLQSVAASCLSLRGSPHALGFSGFIDVNANVATLDLFESSEVTWPNKYTATTVSQERFSVSVSRTTYPKP